MNRKLPDKKGLQAEFIEKLSSLRGIGFEEANRMDMYRALAGAIREQISGDWVRTNRRYRAHGVKQNYYFSMEFLLGRRLEMNLINRGMRERWAEALADMNVELDELMRVEPEPGLGNGGLGRLAACFLESMASLALPGHGCGIRYRYGHFKQEITGGYQVELPDDWMEEDYVWEVRKPDKSVPVRFGGRVVQEVVDGRTTYHLQDVETVLAVPHDFPMIGYRNGIVNTLRLWEAEATEDFDLSSFSKGDYQRADKYSSEIEAISKILYPEDSHAEGRVLRLKQEYFLVSAGIQSIIRTFKKTNAELRHFHDRVAIHINDTHPALAVPELMRLLMDEEGLDWEEAWKVTTRTISFTNHTIMSEALEEWAVDMVRDLLPRIHMIIEEINERFCGELWDTYPGAWDRIADMAVIRDGKIRMANLAVVGSHSVNGVSRLHTQILKKSLFRDFYGFSAHKFNNKTNGITHRRWLLKANPALAELITGAIGESWIMHPEDLIELKERARDPNFLDKLDGVKRENKERLAELIGKKQGVAPDPGSCFDVHIKRIHDYKRQTMNVLHIMHLYNMLKDEPGLDLTPRTFIFAGKAAPGYHGAKATIKLIHTVAELVNNDPDVVDRLRVVFLPNYEVSLAEVIIPAADVSEQISTASREGSGTGNMKQMMNGAVTLGTRDGANIEIMEEVGEENFFAFGLTADEVQEIGPRGAYDPWDIYNSDPHIKRVVDQLIDGFLPAPSNEFRGLHDALLYGGDSYFVLQDFSGYAEAQERIGSAYREQDRWRAMAAVNIAHSGVFSSDRTIREYANGVWELEPFTQEVRGSDDA